MRNESHPTLIGTIRAAVVEWRKREGWSRETVVQEIVGAHERTGTDKATGIVFDPATRDAFERTKVNADRVFRWLDDEGKDNNLLPANFIPSILAALPMDLRIHCLTNILRPLGIDVASSDASSGAGFDANAHVCNMIKESSEASRALLAVGPGASLPALEAACREVQDVQEASSATVRALQAAMTPLRNDRSN